VVVKKRDSSMNNQDRGDILLNPGNYKLPKPFSKNNKYAYYGYIIADNLKDAQAVFENDLMNDKNNASFQSFDSNEKDIIAAEFHRFEGNEEDFNVDIDNIEGGDWLNLC